MFVQRCSNSAVCISSCCLWSPIVNSSTSCHTVCANVMCTVRRWGFTWTNWSFLRRRLLESRFSSLFFSLSNWENVDTHTIKQPLPTLLRSSQYLCSLPKTRLQLLLQRLHLIPKILNLSNISVDTKSYWNGTCLCSVCMNITYLCLLPRV